MLAGSDIEVSSGEESLDNSTVGVTGDEGEGDQHGAGVSSFVEDICIAHLGIKKDGNDIVALT